MTLLGLPAGLDLDSLRKLATQAAKAKPQPAPGDGTPLAVSYLRVSTKDQATRNGLEEGLSIPAQREAAEKKAASLGAVIVKEFIEPGESAKTANRKALQEMLEYVAVNPVQFCIINKVDRMARNRLDDAVIHATLRGRSIQLVSVTENIDESPSGMLMHGILATIAEFYSLNLAQEVVKGLRQKAVMGGTPGRAPLGYLNVRTTENGAEIREVTTDPDRFDLVKFAFESYANGDWTLSMLTEEVNRRGLTTRPTPKHPEKPLTTTMLHKVLTNPYYKGLVTFQGAVYEGSHDVMVTPEVWSKVQQILDRNNQRGQRPQKHDHYLKGALYCSCGAKLMLERPQGNTGERYDYFSCSGRRRKTTSCTRSAILVERIELKVEQAYATKSLTEDQAAGVGKILHEVFDRLEGGASDERAALTEQKARLESERLKLVQAHYADAIPVDLLKSEQDRIQNALGAIQTRLDSLHSRYADAREGLEDMLAVLTDLQGLYLRCEPAERRFLNQALFTRIIVDENENVELQPQAGVDTVTSQRINTYSAGPVATTKMPRIQAGQVSTFELLVDLRGFEPLTSSLRTKRATNCATGPYGSTTLSPRRRAFELGEQPAGSIPADEKGRDDVVARRTLSVERDRPLAGGRADAQPHRCARELVLVPVRLLLLEFDGGVAPRHPAPADVDVGAPGRLHVIHRRPLAGCRDLGLRAREGEFVDQPIDSRPKETLGLGQRHRSALDLAHR